MNFKDYIKTAFGNLKKRKMRTFLTSFAIAIGTMLIITMVSLGVGMQEMILKEIAKQASVKAIHISPYKNMDSVNINLTSEDEEKAAEERRKSYKKMGGADIEKVKKLAGVEDLQVMINTSITKSQIGDKKSHRNMAVGYDLNYSIFAQTDIKAVCEKQKDNQLEPMIAGRILKQGDKNAVMVGQKYLSAMGIKDYQSVIGKEISITCATPQFQGAAVKAPYEIKAEIVGVIHEKFPGSESITMPIEMAAALQGYYNNDTAYLQNSGATSAVAYAKSLDDVKPVSEEIKKIGYGVQTYQSIVDQVKSMFAIFQGILAVGGGIVLFVAALGVINTMTMAIYERTRSIGIMKAVGASKGTIRRLFIMESGALGFIGGIAGLLFGLFNTRILGFILNQYVKSKGGTPAEVFSMPVWLVLGGVSFAVLISMLAGLYPAARASKLDPIVALRYE